MGQISTGQTNPDEPDYFPPFLRQKLLQVNLIAFFHTSNLKETREEDFNSWKHRTDNINNIPSLDFLNKAYISKKGQNRLVSKETSVEIKPSGGLYDGVDLSVKKFIDKDLRLKCEHSFTGKARL